MPLFIQQNGFEFNVAADLAHIVQNDGGLGTPAVAGNPNLIQVTYAEGPSTPVRDRINQLCNNIPNFPIVIAGQDQTTTFPDGSPAVGGETGATALNAAKTGAAAGATINVVYDTSDCSGNHLFAFDMSGNTIPGPTEVVLYHELSHALHLATNTLNPTNDEPAAETDENVLRAQEGLPLRDINNHGGGCGGPGGTSKCFIVTAAYGSPAAPQVAALRSLRDTTIRRTVVGDYVFEHLLAEYYTFSPRVADEVRVSSVQRREIERWAVEPLVSCLSVLTQYADRGWMRPDFAAEVEARLSGDLAALGDVTTQEIRAVADGWTTLATARNDETSDGGLPPVLRYLRDQAHGLESMDHLRWGLLVPIALYWTALARRAEGEAGVGARLLAEMADWLASVPLPPNLLRLGGLLADELCRLRASVFSPVEVRRAFAARLLNEGKGRADLLAVLAAAGYVPGGSE